MTSAFCLCCLIASLPPCLVAFLPCSLPLTDLLLGLACFAAGWLFLNFADAYESQRVSVRCACGRRELRNAIIAPQDRGRLAQELTAACPWCDEFSVNSSRLSALTSDYRQLTTSPAVSYLGDHDD